MVYKLLKCRSRKYFTIILLLTSSLSFSQNKVSGAVLNNDTETLSYANITVYNEDETTFISYAISDEVGKYNLELENGNYLFKVSYLGYKSFSVKKNILKDEIIDFKLIEDATSLDEVMIKAKSLDASIRNDTIKYNLKRLTTSNEENLKDVINKLPGIEIDENGKIKAHGKKIDKLLIDGKEFFGDQHQLATENISSEMIKGISLLKNFDDISNLDNQTKSGKTAMNIEIGDDYKGNVKGNMAVAGGYQNKYEFNTNLFSFGKKTNLFFIASSNNIGNQTFTFQDYISFQGGVQKLLENNSNATSISTKDLPSYLFSNDEVKSKDEQFSAFNFSFNPSNKFKLNSYVIFDRTNVNEEQLATQTYITTPENITLNIENTRENTFLINNSFINAIYKPSNKSIFEYTFSFSPQNNNITSADNFDVRNFKTKRTNRSFVLNQVFNYKQKINNYFLTSSLYHSIKNGNEVLNLFSNNNFLGLTFKDKNYSAFQDINSSNNNVGLNTVLSKKITQKSSFEIKYSISKNVESFESNIVNNSLSNNIKLDVLENLVGLRFYNKKKAFINYNIGSNFSFLNTNKLKNYNFLPFADAKINFKKSHSLHLSYKRTIQLPQANNILENRYISNFNTLIDNQNMVANTIAKYDNFSLKYFIYDLFSGTLLSFGGDLIFGKDITATNSLNFADYRTNNFLLGDNDKNISSYLLFDKKFSKIPFSIRLKNTFSLLEKNNFIENENNRLDSNILSNNIKISSNFNKSLFNFELGYRRRQNSIQSKSINIDNKVILNAPYLNAFFNYNKFSLTINNSIEFYNSSDLNQQFYRIDPVLNYKTKNNKWTFYVKGNDMLNMNRNFIIKNAVYENFFEVKRVSTLGGFVIAGLKYKF